MIDVESEVFTRVADKLREKFPDVKENGSVTGEYVAAPVRFPHISIVEMDNYQTTGNIDNSGQEQYATVVYEVNVYSNKTSGKKTECREIMVVLDDVLNAMNFTRQSMVPVPNLENNRIYRITARYRAETDGSKFFRLR